MPYVIRCKKDEIIKNYHGKEIFIARKGFYFEKGGSLTSDLNRANLYLTKKEADRALWDKRYYEIVKVEIRICDANTN